MNGGDTRIQIQREFWRYLMFICGWYAHLGTNIKNVKATKKFLRSNFDVKGVVEANMIFEIKILDLNLGWPLPNQII